MMKVSYWLIECLLILFDRHLSDRHQPPYPWHIISTQPNLIKANAQAEGYTYI